MPSRVGISLQQLERRMIRAAERSLIEEADAIIQEARRIVPYDTGALQSTGRVSPTQVTSQAIEVAIGFGDPARGVDYALEQHENLEYRHVPGRTAKYLEVPFMQAVGQLESRLAFRLRAALRE